ncbi:MAG: carbohydrate-binding family 9-like protein [Verrucomicrobia bacterium]|nr:carbohydrate-binding family 9-like protein [Verrucomicrobiota bacterium]
MMNPRSLCRLLPQYARTSAQAAVTILVLFAFDSASALSGAEPVDLAKLLPPKRVVVPKLKGDLKLDGKLEESVWKQAAVLKPFLPNNGGGQEREGTEVRLWFDDQALHMAWTCTDSDIQATFTKRDSRFWEEEVAEFFVTAGGLERYFELQWNPLGGVFDAIIDNELAADGVSKKFTGNWDYTAQGMKSGVFVKGTVANSADKDSFWQVEVSVPFSDLNRSTPKPGEVWRANFYRFNRGKDQPAELLSWSPTQLAGFHQPSRFGYLQFGK